MSQDKMLTDIPAEMLQELCDASTDAGNLLFLPWSNIKEMRNETAERINAAIAAIRSLPCVRQSSQSQQDARDAARYQWMKSRQFPEVFKNPMGFPGKKWFVTSVDGKSEDLIGQGNDPDSAIDSAIAAQGASNV